MAGGSVGFHSGFHADVWIDRDFDGLSDMFIGSGFPVEGFPERTVIFNVTSLEEIDSNGDGKADLWRSGAVTTSVKVD